MKKFIVLAGVGGFAVGVVTGIVAAKIAQVIAKKAEENLCIAACEERCEGCDCEEDCADCLMATCGLADNDCPRCPSDIKVEMAAEKTEAE